MSEDQIVRRKLSDEIFDRLMEMITSGRLAAGDSLPSERDLMERFGVGRPTIREAMQALANLGLVQISHGERARVVRPSGGVMIRQMDLIAQILLDASPDNLQHLKDSRRFFERGMARIAAERATAEDLAALEDALLAQRQKIGIPKDFISADMAFHRRIARISGNPIFESVSEAMLNWLQRYHKDLLIWSGKEGVTLAEHRDIIDRIAAGDQDGAESAMITHLDRSAGLYVPRRQ